MDRKDLVKPLTVWKHFKGGEAFVLAIANHSETGEPLVIYRCTGNGKDSNHKDGIYARPLDMFLSEVDTAKYPNATQRYRFECVQEEGLATKYGVIFLKEELYNLEEKLEKEYELEELRNSAN